jgi:hypothetical protein
MLEARPSNSSQTPRGSGRCMDVDFFYCPYNTLPHDIRHPFSGLITDSPFFAPSQRSLKLFPLSFVIRGRCFVLAIAISYLFPVYHVSAGGDWC